MGALTVTLVLAVTVSMIVSSTLSGTTSLLRRPDLDVAARPAPPVPVTQPGAPAGSVPSRVLVVGDSVAFTLATGFEHESLEDDLVVWNQAVLYCELLHVPREEAGEVRPPSDSCRAWRSSWAGAVAEFDPEVVVLHVGPWEVFDRVVDGTALAWGAPELDDLLRDALTDAVEILGGRGATVVLLASPPLDRTDGVSNAEWTLAERDRIAHLNGLLTDVAGSARVPVEVIDLGELVCPVPATGCPGSHDGVELRGDGVHYTAEGAEVAADWLAPRLRRLAIEGSTDHPGGTPP